MARRSLSQLPIWFTGITLSMALLMIVGLLTLILAKGLRTFWPEPVWQVTLADGTEHLGLVHKAEAMPAGSGTRTLYRTGNRDLTGADFVWVEDARVERRIRPADAAVVERLEWGPFYGFLSAVSTPNVDATGTKAWDALQAELPRARGRQRAIRRIERRVIGDINHEIEAHRLALQRLKLRKQLDTPGGRAEADRRRAAMRALEAQYAGIAQDLRRRREADGRYRVTLTALDGTQKTLPVSSLVRVHRPNRLSWSGKAGVYASRMREFIFGQPREANAEGGVAPAIFGTVMMTLLMSLAVVPLGVLAALYLHEYAKQGAIVSAVRIAVNNLAGVPSIVFGVFGLGFFCYIVGGSIDALFYPERLPTPTFGGGGILWASLTLALLTVPVVIVATEEALAAVPNGVREASMACGATKFQTIWRVVLPAAVPGILTGAILAMARGAGEVAPLMITGVVKLAPELPVDHLTPFLHVERKFMHLGFHIYDVGFQSPNIEASKAMVYMTTTLLLALVVCLNLTAMSIRGRLRDSFRGAEV